MGTSRAADRAAWDCMQPHALPGHTLKPKPYPRNGLQRGGTPYSALYGPVIDAAYIAESIRMTDPVNWRRYD